MPGSTTTAALERAVHRYRRAPLLARWFVHGRAFLSDLARVEEYVPRHGFVVDLGCGHGLFANLLAEASPRRRILGLDIDDRKIAVARATIAGRDELRFEVSDVIHVPPPRCDAVTIVDVLYLLPFEEQERVLRNAATALAEGAPLIVKSQEARIDPRYALTYAQEVITVSLGFTRGGSSRFHFPSRETALAMFERAGFRAEAVDMRRRPYTDVLYLARRSPAA
ncbi:MAG: class I SAM-dependent methyltransferase [Chloroflexota bacterium]|nr:class I SAM-dependent methyltransferase [Chloroflexota bacterium]MDE3193690.1 class I SAM-dependent methyltransferase [Chloroflexota bacterium]